MNKCDQVNSILNSIKKSKLPEAVNSDDENEIVNKTLPVIPRGRPKSGKIWKTPKQRFNSIKKTKGLQKTFAEKQALRTSLKNIKEISRSIQEEKKAEKEAKKERRRQNLKRAEENKLKSEIVQVISNPAKIKRMKKKQLRYIQKRDTSQYTK